MSWHVKFQLALLAAALPSLAVAQGGPLGADRPIPPTPFPVGSGARAAGMGNAFVAIADDATAATWNPAGLVQLERPELSLVGESLWTTDDLRSTVQPETKGSYRFDDASINFASFVYPIPRPIAGRNVVLSLSYQRRYDFTRNLGGRMVTSQGVLGTILTQNSRLSFDQNGGLSAVAPSIAVELTHRLSVGASLNIWRSDLFGENGWEQHTNVDSIFLAGTGLTSSLGASSESYEDIHGESFTLGALWQVAGRWALGLRYDSALNADAAYSASDRDLRLTPGAPMPILPNVTHLEEHRKLRLPDTWSAGVAYRRNDKLTFSLDISRTGWNDAYITTGSGQRISMVDGADLNNPLQRTGFDPTYAVRLGTEYVFIPKQRGETLDYLWTLRGGLFMEQEPASGRNDRRATAPGTGEPDDFYGASVGLGLLLKQRVNIDAAYVFRFGNGVNGDINPGVAGFDADEHSHRFLLSTVIYF